MTTEAKPDTWMRRFPKVRVGSSLRLEIHLSNFSALTMALSCAEMGELMRMLMAEAASEPVAAAARETTQRAYDRRDEYRVIRGGIGRRSLGLAKRRAVFERDDQRCGYCGQPLTWETYHCDHVEPVSKGGSDDLENLRAACVACNLSKKAKSLDEWAANA